MILHEGCATVETNVKTYCHAALTHDVREDSEAIVVV
jgi:hypothetical protein